MRLIEQRLHNVVRQLGGFNKETDSTGRQKQFWILAVQMFNQHCERVAAFGAFPTISTTNDFGRVLSFESLVTAHGPQIGGIDVVSFVSRVYH